ncbi:MAG TPA: hypothetical protein VN903_07525 [Polyangia bacterium]|jgi:hypothetical protein|nr:hypothetical protein [Polyangia bacterium]
MRRWIAALAVCFALLALRVPLPAAFECHDCHAGIAQAAEQAVFFNTKSLIYHHDGCMAANRCTVNCIWIPRADAIKRGGRPCKLCGG